MVRWWEDQTFKSDESINELFIHEDCNCQLDLSSERCGQKKKAIFGDENRAQNVYLWPTPLYVHTITVHSTVGMIVFDLFTINSISKGVFKRLAAHSKMAKNI